MGRLRSSRRIHIALWWTRLRGGSHSQGALPLKPRQRSDFNQWNKAPYRWLLQCSDKFPQCYDGLFLCKSLNYHNTNLLRMIVQCFGRKSWNSLGDGPLSDSRQPSWLSHIVSNNPVAVVFSGNCFPCLQDIRLFVWWTSLHWPHHFSFIKVKTEAILLITDESTYHTETSR